MARAHRRLAVAASIATLLAGHGVAQVPVGDTSRKPPVDTSRKSSIDPTLLKPASFVYDMSLERDASTTPLGTRTVSVATTPYAGSPAWLMLETRVGERIAATDSLFVDPSLHPLHWTAILGQARLAAEFRGDSAYGATSGPPGRRQIVMTVPPRTMVSGAMLESILRIAPIQVGWEDTVATLSVSLTGASVSPTRMYVVGEDRVVVPAGTFDCWVVAVQSEGSKGLYWVTKRDPIIVRSTLDVPALGGAQLVSALTRIAR
ncbi:MAG TPA: hypothetical protein VNS10_14185 [Gemmatimonadaceae bacterium]|nr:hypothetical protein [Gemmatimonadaceae bacterium]